MTHRRVGNPLAATVVSVVIAGAGVWLVGAAKSPTGVVFGVMFAVVGVLAALGNLYVWKRYRDDDLRR
jgi:O-antigen/teichoic acid export membrane protein